MYRAKLRAITMGATLAGLSLASRQAEAVPRSFVTIRDDGTLSAKRLTSPDVVTKSVMAAYDKANPTRPDVISLWTTFPMDGNVIETLFDPLSNDIAGIGLESTYRTPDGTGKFESAYAPTRAILLHNDATALEARAKKQNAPVDGFARYLFLLELSHLWGPTIKLPVSDAGPSANALIGFDFHWSFWMDAGGSPAGGNAWKDNGDGTFTASGQSPKTIQYSMLDLYLMGLADPSEVKPFGLLEGAEPPADVKDPLFGGTYGARSFPWFGEQPFTVKATGRTISIDDVITANGPRVPARSNGEMTLGVVLVVKATASDEEVAALEEKFEPLAASFAPAFHEATHERGTFTNVTAKEVPTPDDAGASVDAGAPAPATATAPTASSGGCDVAGGAHGSLALAGLVALALLRRSRRTARHLAEEPK